VAAHSFLNMVCNGNETNEIDGWQTAQSLPKLDDRRVGGIRSVLRERFQALRWFQLDARLLESGDATAKVDMKLQLGGLVLYPAPTLHRCPSIFGMLIVTAQTGILIFYVQRPILCLFSPQRCETTFIDDSKRSNKPHNMGVEEQKEEREILESIYPEEITGADKAP